ncbi:hypothetical protein MRS44_004911 [Fusarium solani]|uniref:uncharacterized protein n=1 Tax=Fusarium solani TaxID=169388 RepID=UPI0032C4035C|nr:hypothetical protein MRS44_004911 [Fusarium solani]
MLICSIRDTQTKLKETPRPAPLATTPADEMPFRVRMGFDLKALLHPRIPHDRIESQVQISNVTWDGNGENIARLAEDDTLKRFRDEIAIEQPDTKKIKLEFEEELGLETDI